MRNKFDATVFSAQIPVLVEMSSFLTTQSVTETPLESQVLMQIVECHSKTVAVSEHCHHFSAFNEQCHISFCFKYPVDNFKFLTMPWKNSLEIVLNSFPFGHTQIESASSRYLGLQGKYFQGYQNVFEAVSIAGCGAPGPRIDNAGLSQIRRSRVW